MRLISIAVIAAICGYAAEYTVCKTPGECNYTDLQAALDVAQLGDVITLKAGETFSRPGGFTIKPMQGDGWLRIRSSRMNEMKEGYRVGPAEAAAGLLPKIAAAHASEVAIQLGPLARQTTVNVDTNILQSNGHGMTDGMSVQVQGNVGSPFVCTGVGIPLAGADCAAEKVGKFQIRGRTGFTPGMAVRLFGLTLPEPFQRDTPYFVVSSVDNSSLSLFELSDTPGGQPIVPATSGSGFSYEVPPYPLLNGETLYVVNAATNTFQLSRVAGGEPVDLLSTGVGQGYAPGVLVRQSTTVRNVILEGLEVTVQPGLFVWILVMLGEGAYSEATMPANIVIDRSYIHGNPGDLGPHQCVYVNARDVTIANSTINECKSNYADAQAILVMSSAGGIRVENNRLEGSGETIMFGGGYPSFTGVTPEGVLIRRNFFTKPLAWRGGLSAAVVNPQMVHVRQWGRAEPCSTAAANAEGAQCFVYDIQGERHSYTRDLTMTAPSGSGRILFMYDNGLKAVHNLQSLTCSEDIECVQSAAPSWPPTATRLHDITVANSAFTSSSTQIPVVKNAFEVKHGKNMVLEGNIFEHAWMAAQSSLIVLNVQAVSTLREALNYWAVSTDIVLRNNILRKANTAYGSSGRGYGRPESNGFGRGGRHLFRNNLVYDIDATRWAHNVSVSTSVTMTASQTQNVLFDHNTFAGVEAILRLNGNVGPTVNDYISLHNNIVIPRPGLGFAGVGGDGIISFLQAKTLKHNVNGTMIGNVLLNVAGTTSWARPNTDYPPDTWLMMGQNTPESVGFVDWTGKDFRLQTGTRFAATCKNDCVGRGIGGRSLGADLDEIYALTRGVEEGWPEWSVRAGVRVDAGLNAAMLQWDTMQGSNCELKVYPDASYADVIADVDPSIEPVRARDVRATLADGMKRFSVGRYVPLVPQTKYYYKLFCGAEVAVGSFETLSAAAAVNVQHTPPAGTVALQTSHGWTEDALADLPEIPCSADECSASVPAGGHMQWTYRDSTGRSNRSRIHAVR